MIRDTFPNYRHDTSMGYPASSGFSLAGLLAFAKSFAWRRGLSLA